MVRSSRSRVSPNGTRPPRRRAARSRTSATYVDLREIRLKGKAGIARAPYVTAQTRRVVIVRAFVKKTEKAPSGEIELALQRAKEVKP